MIEALLALAVALIGALGWAKVERTGRKREKDRADRNARILDIHDRVRDEDRRIDEAMREAEGADFEERDERLRDPNRF